MERCYEGVPSTEEKRLLALKRTAKIVLNF